MAKHQKWTKNERLKFMTYFRGKLKESGLKSKLTLSKENDIIEVFIKEQDESFDKYAVIGPTGSILKAGTYESIKEGKLIYHKETVEQKRINGLLKKILESLSHKVTGYGLL